MGFQKNYKHENLALNLELVSFWDKCFLFNIYFLLKKYETKLLFLQNKT